MSCGGIGRAGGSTMKMMLLFVTLVGIAAVRGQAADGCWFLFSPSSTLVHVGEGGVGRARCCVAVLL